MENMCVQISQLMYPLYTLSPCESPPPLFRFKVEQKAQGDCVAYLVHTNPLGDFFVFGFVLFYFQFKILKIQNTLIDLNLLVHRMFHTKYQGTQASAS